MEDDGNGRGKGRGTAVGGGGGGAGIERKELQTEEDLMDGLVSVLLLMKASQTGLGRCMLAWRQARVCTVCT